MDKQIKEYNPVDGQFFLVFDKQEKMIGKAYDIQSARLIAGAPELLAALQKIDSNAAESAEWIRRVARAAIAKATQC